MKEYPTRHTIRLKEYDYSQDGMYFVTICTQNRANVLWHGEVGAIINRPRAACQFSDVGKIVDQAIQNINQRYIGITVDKYVVMPNHVHMLLSFQQSQSGNNVHITTLQNVIKQMKSYVTKQVRRTVWQKSFYDHIIRDEAEYQRIWKYIDENPLKWELDCYYKITESTGD